MMNGSFNTPWLNDSTHEDTSGYSVKVRYMNGYINCKIDGWIYRWIHEWIYSLIDRYFNTHWLNDSTHVDTSGYSN